MNLAADNDLVEDRMLSARQLSVKQNVSDSQRFDKQIQYQAEHEYQPGAHRFTNLENN